MLSLVEGKRKGWGETGKKSIFSTVMLIIINDNSPLIEASFSGKNQARNQPARCVCVGVWTWMGGTQTRIQDFLKGGWRHSIHKHPPPLGHCLRDVIRPLKNWKIPPLLDIHKHHPLGHCPCDVIHIPRGGDRSRSRTLCIGFQYRDKFKGGGDHPCPPPDPPLEHYTGYGWAVYIMAETRSLAPIAVDG